MQGMDPDDYSIIVPPGFDDSDDEAQVHPMARRLFPGRTPAEVFAKAAQWVGKHDLTVVDVSWKSWLRRAGALYPRRLLHVRIQPLCSG